MTDAADSPARTCEQLASALGTVSSWEWDDRFGAALTSFDKSDEPTILAALDESFDRIWSQAELADGPDHVAALARRLGGLRSGQMLLTAFTDGPGPTLFCAWWPWGSGTRISIRVGAIAGPDGADPAPVTAAVRAAFGV